MNMLYGYGFCIWDISLQETLNIQTKSIYKLKKNITSWETKIKPQMRMWAMDRLSQWGVILLIALSIWSQFGMYAQACFQRL